MPGLNHTPLKQTRRVEPVAADWRCFGWASGSFDRGRRPRTANVEGIIEIPHHLLLVTLSGTARRLEVRAECGHRYAGPDFAGAVSYVPAGCGRQLRMQDVEAEWASISLRPDLLDDPATGRPFEIPTFTNLQDPYIASAVGEMARLEAEGGRLDATYCDAMAIALGKYLVYRYGKPVPQAPRRHAALPHWRLRRITDFVEANLNAEIAIVDLAAVAGLSVGHFHRALRGTLGITPLEFVTQRRIERAQHLLATEGPPIAELSLRVGFASPSHFARLFRRLTGVNPSVYRDGRRG